MKRKASRARGVTTLIKYIFAIILTVLTCRTSHSVSYAAAGLLELTMVFLLSDVLLRKNRIAGNVVNAVLMLLYCAQMAVLYLGGSYISSIMISNLNMAEDLGGKATIYVGAGVAVVLVSMLPIKPNLYCEWLRRTASGFFVLTLCLISVVFVTGVGSESNYSPFSAYVVLAKEQKEYKALAAAASAEASEKSDAERERDAVSDDSGGIANNTVDLTACSDSAFYRETVEDFREKDAALGAQPNVILIFTEGLSRHIIEDERNIMPNVKALEEKSLHFENYYNHTAATFSGLIGQLYSGYQLGAQESNGLISLQAVFGAEGYHTVFINSEPGNEEFTTYLESFDFDELLGCKDDPCSGIVDGTMSDKEAYKMLFDTAESLSETEEPFFLSMYTFGTHVSLDGVDGTYGDGSDAMLNKFYDADQQFGTFMEKLQESDLMENTVVIFTADHCTCSDQDFAESFPEHERTAYFLDEIPLLIYYEGITPETIDANGMNSLDLAPTVCDYLDISTPNCFLGKSLFRDNTMFAELDTVYFDGSSYYTTKNDEIAQLDKDAVVDVKSKIVQYFADKNR